MACASSNSLCSRSPSQEGEGEGWGGPMPMQGVSSPQAPYHPELSPQAPYHPELSPTSTPHKAPHSPGHPISPMTPHGYTSPITSPQKPPTNFIANNPGYYRGATAAPGAPQAPHWGPDLAILPSQAPQYDEFSQPPIASSLYGQDLRYNQYY